MRFLISLLLALAVLLPPVSAPAQWQVPLNSVPIGRGPGVSGFTSVAPGGSGNCLVSNGTTWVSGGCGGTVYTPQAFGAVGDGVTDDTTAWKGLCAAVQAAGGGSIISPTNKNYRVYSAGQSIATPMCSFANITFSIDMNGSKFTVDRVFTTTNPINVTGTANSGGLVRLTVASSAGFYNGESVTVAGVVGTTEANGTWTITVPDSTHITLAGTTFANAYVSGGTVTQNTPILYLMLNSNNNNVYIKDWRYVQTTGVTLPNNTFQGTEGIAIASAGGGNYTIINPSATGGIQNFHCVGNAYDSLASSTANITIIGGQAVNTYYGMNFANNCNNVTVRDYYVEGAERSYFAYGVQNHDISIRTRNHFANDVLLAGGSTTVDISNVTNNAGTIRLTLASTTGFTTGDTVSVANVTGTTNANGIFIITVINGTTIDLNGSTFGPAPWAGGGTFTDIIANRPLSDIRLNYQVLKRTSGVQPTSYLTFNSVGGPNGTFGNIFNVQAMIDMDYSGETAGVSPAITFLKSTVSPYNSTTKNVVISGTIIGVPSSVNHLIDIGPAADAPWSSEAFENISFENFQVLSSFTNFDFRVDYAPFVTTTAGAFGLRNVKFPGAFTEVNAANATIIRAGLNAAFVGGAQVLFPSFGGTGLFQPAIHTIPVAQGAAAMNLITLTNGQLIVGQTGADPQAKTISGAITLAASGTSSFGAQNANTVIGNATGGSAAPTAVTPIVARSSALLNTEAFTGVGNTNYTILVTDRTVGTNAAFTAPRTWTLPAANAVNAGGVLRIMDFQGTVTSTNTLIIARAGADTINGGTSYTLSSVNAGVELVSDGISKWTAQPSASAGVPSVGGVTGAIGVANGIAMSGSNIQLSAGRLTLPTFQSFASGATNYVSPANVIYIIARICGAGGGGSGSGTTAGDGGAGGNTTFSTLTANGGGPGLAAGSTATGGTATGGDLNITGQYGSFPPQLTAAAGGIGGYGGNSFMGPGGTGGTLALTPGAAGNCGGGGGGGAATGNQGSGGAAGGYVEKLMTPGTYAYSVGSAGSAGSAGGSGNAGAAGGSGFVFVREYYN